MTTQEWLDRYGYTVELNRRGFRFETSKGEVFNVFVIEDGVKAIKHITLADVYTWVGKELKRGNPAFSTLAQEDYYEIGV